MELGTIEAPVYDPGDLDTQAEHGIFVPGLPFHEANANHSKECKRRKVKCSGETPCHHCRRHQVQCLYSKHLSSRSGKLSYVDSLPGDNVPPLFLFLLLT